MKTWFIPVAVFTLFGAVAQAQDEPAPTPTAAPTVRQACQADRQKFCAGVQRGGGRIRACIAEHRDDLSQGCRDALLMARSRLPKSAAPPAQDPGKPQ